MVDASVLVVGAGAIGGGIAACLEGGVRRLAVLDADPEHVRLMRDPGLEMDDLGTVRTVRLDAHARAEEVEGSFDFALLGVKAPHHRTALEPLVEREVAETYVSLGNGLIQDRLGEIVGRERLVAALVEWGGTNLGPGRIMRDTHAPIVVGELDGEERPRTRRLLELLQLVGEARVTTNARGMIWSKLLVNSSFTGLSAVSGLRYGGVAEDPDGRESILGLWREGYAVGRAEGLELDHVFGMSPEEMVVLGPDDRPHAEEVLDRAMGRWGNTLPSMLQDLWAGRATEVDVVNGGVAGRGRAQDVLTPLNDRVVELVHAMERGERRPEPEALAEVRALLP
jgi:2-dehydropantoate 2-reductase